MMVSTKGRYALRMMIYIASKGEGARSSLREVSEDQNISLKYLEQLVGSLIDCGLLKSIRGAHGGYSLTRPAEEITAGEIIRAAEGTCAPVACLEKDAEPCPRKQKCETLQFWRGLDDAISGYTDSVTLAALIPQ